MKIFTANIHPNGFFINADWKGDYFWIYLSRALGWGKFTLIRRSTTYSVTGGIFELSELQQEDSLLPSPIIHSSNVLWRLQEAHEVLISS